MLRLFESNEVAAAPQILSGSPGIPQALPQQGGHWDQDPVSYIFKNYKKRLSINDVNFRAISVSQSLILSIIINTSIRAR